ncbi:immunity 53 family protein [Clostridium pasteurianum]|nr:immunity 53 family protein [Clostridium pasteurianum]
MSKKHNIILQMEMIVMNILKWIGNWYAENCDGDWEHSYGVNISNLDNPGWMVNIDLTNTKLENLKFDTIDISRSDTDWVYCNVIDEVFQGNGGANNLEEILNIFREWVNLNTEIDKK